MVVAVEIKRAPIGLYVRAFYGNDWYQYRKCAAPEDIACPSLVSGRFSHGRGMFRNR